MCGIIGIASNKPVSINIINSLKKLEYRGYDSAGLATLSNNEIDEIPCCINYLLFYNLLLEIILLYTTFFDCLKVYFLGT